MFYCHTAGPVEIMYYAKYKEQFVKVQVIVQYCTYCKSFYE